LVDNALSGLWSSLNHFTSVAPDFCRLDSKDGFTPTYSDDALVYQIDIEIIETGYRLKAPCCFEYSLALPHVPWGITDVLENDSVRKDDQGNVPGVFAAARRRRPN